MTVRKFRSIEEMKGERWYEPGSAELMDALREIGRLASFSVRLRFPPGLHKHRSIEEMNAATEVWDRANFEQHQAHLRLGKT